MVLYLVRNVLRLFYTVVRVLWFKIVLLVPLRGLADLELDASKPAKVEVRLPLCFYFSVVRLVNRVVVVRDGETQHVRVAGNALLESVGDVCLPSGEVVWRIEPLLKIPFYLPLAGLLWIYALSLLHAEFVICLQA